MSDVIPTSGGNGAVVARASMESGELFPVDPTSGPPAFWSNFKADEPGGASLVMKCFGQADVKSDDAIGREFRLTRVLLHNVTLVKEETGEVNEAVRSVLIDEDGKTLAFCSGGIFKSLRVLCLLKGAGPWSPPLRVVVKQITTKAARRTYTLELNEDVPSVIPDKGRTKNAPR